MAKLFLFTDERRWWEGGFVRMGVKTPKNEVRKRGKRRLKVQDVVQEDEAEYRLLLKKHVAK